MKKYVFTTFILLIIFVSCRKNISGNQELIGSWKLIEVYDKSTTTTSFPPPGSNNNVVITFLSGNRFFGNTLKNSITDGTFSHNEKEISFKDFSMTKVNEDQLGGNFLTVLRACILQSVSPCIPSEYSIQGKTMKIVSVLRYDITLEKL